MTYEVQFSKGSYSVDMHADNVSEEFNNKLIILNIPQVSTNQSAGKKSTNVLDLLQITHQFLIKGYVAKNSTKSGFQQKEDLLSIADGGGTNGGTISMTYDSKTYTGYLEKITVIRKPHDEPSIESKDEIRYELSITFVVGTSI